MQIKKVKKNAGQVLPKTGFCILLSSSVLFHVFGAVDKTSILVFFSAR